MRDTEKGTPEAFDVTATIQRIEAAIPQIEEIRALFQAPSLSIGVRRRGKTIFHTGLGLANRETRRPPDQHTTYAIASCTKGFTGTILSLLAERGRLRLDSPVSDVIPALDTENSPMVAKHMTVRDMLSHCAGLATLPYTVIGKHGAVFTRREDVLDIFNHLPKAVAFKTEWMYNNWLFALAGRLIEQESGGLSFGQVVKKEIFDKVGMKRSITSSKLDENHAVPYVVFDASPAEPRELPSLVDRDAFAASGSIRSCVADMLPWTGALMRAWREHHGYEPLRWQDTPPPRSEPVAAPNWLFSCIQSFWPSHAVVAKDGDSLPGGELRIAAPLTAALAQAQTPHFPVGDDLKQQYAQGLFHFQLPTSEMNVVTNADINTRNYIIGKDSKKRVAIGHTGELGGFLSVYWTFPEEDSSVVVLCNSFQINGDPTNIVSQFLVQLLFDLRPAVDFVQVARDIVHNAKARWDTMLQDWTSHRRTGTNPRPLSAYHGLYKNEGLALTLEVSANQALPRDSASVEFPLQVSINGKPKQLFPLRHFHDDAWTFLCTSRDECIRQGYSHYLYSWESFIVEFLDFKDGKAGQIRWKLDGDSRVGPQLFVRSK